MRKNLINLVVFLFTFSVQSNVPVDFSSKHQEAIFASEINQNINFINSILSPFGFNQIAPVSSGVISSQQFNSIFDLIQNEEDTVIFSEGEAISSLNLSNNFNVLFIASKNLVPNSCKELLQRRPELLNLNNVYYIDLDGYDGPLPPAMIYCDMTTAGGGWTNVANNVAGYTNSLLVDGSASTLSSVGLSDASTADNLLNGSQTGIGSGNNCGTVYRNLRIKSELLNKLNAIEVKIDARSYGSGAVLCGGILGGGIGYVSGSLTAISPVNFNLLTLGTCSGSPGQRFWEFSNSQYYHFRYTLTSNTNNPMIAGNVVNCGNGAAYYQIRSIMVR